MSASDTLITVALFVTCFAPVIALACRHGRRHDLDRAFVNQQRRRDAIRRATCTHPRVVPYSQPMNARTRYRHRCAVCGGAFVDHPTLDRDTARAVRRDGAA